MSDQAITRAEIGRLGGLATRAKIGSAGYRRLAAIRNSRAGYRAQRASLGPAGMAAKARAGGEALLAQRGKEHFAELARRRWARRKEGT
jgi:hypothetical protein